MYEKNPWDQPQMEVFSLETHSHPVICQTVSGEYIYIFFYIVKTFIFGISQLDSVSMIPILLATSKAS